MPDKTTISDFWGILGRRKNKKSCLCLQWLLTFSAWASRDLRLLVTFFSSSSSSAHLLIDMHFRGKKNQCKTLWTEKWMVYTPQGESELLSRGLMWLNAHGSSLKGLDCWHLGLLKWHIVKLPILPHLWKSQEMNYWNSTSELRTEEVSLMSSKTSLNIHPFTHFSTHVIYLNLPVLPMIFFYIFRENI